MDQRWVPHALDKLATNACIDWRNQTQPETRQAWREDGHRDYPSPQSALPRVLLHDFAIADLVGTADLKDCGLFDRQIQCSHKISHDIFDRNRLGFYSYPSRTNHDRQALYKSTNHLKREASGADDNRGSKFDRRNRRTAQDICHFVATPQMCG